MKKKRLKSLVKNNFRVKKLDVLDQNKSVFTVCTFKIS